jgi:hypothetical protein
MRVPPVPFFASPVLLLLDRPSRARLWWDGTGTGTGRGDHRRDPIGDADQLSCPVPSVGAGATISGQSGELLI